jgi:hypothetical protein
MNEPEDDQKDEAPKHLLKEREVIRLVVQEEKEKKQISSPLRKTLIFLGSINLKFAAYISILFFLIIYIQMKRQRCLFEYTQLPKAWKDSGISEENVVNSINDMMNRIANHEGDFRNLMTNELSDSETLKEKSKNVGKLKKESSISGHEYASLSTMSLQGIPLKTFIHVTDRLVSLIGFNTDNYVSLEFSVKTSSAHLAIHFQGHRETFSTPILREDIHQAILLLCYQASIFLLTETDPIHLVEYYYDIGEYEACARACITTINRSSSKQEKSRAYLLWGLLTPYYSETAQEKIRQAVSLDKNNQVAKFLSLDTNYSESSPLPDIQKLVHRQPGEPLYWMHWLYDIDPEIEYLDSLYIQQVAPSFHTCQKLLTLTYPTEAASVVYWALGKKLERLARVYPAYLDTSIHLYKKALERELAVKNMSLKKMSEYNNAIAFAYQQKAFLSIPIKFDTCYATISRTDDFDNHMELSYQYVKESLAIDSLNPWSWSTLGEYHGLMYQIDPQQKENLHQSLFALERAYRYGLDIDFFVYDTEPYCFLYKTEQKAFDKILQTPRYYEGELRGLRLLRVTKPDFVSPLTNSLTK